MSKSKNESKKIRDFVRIGIFSALWIAVSFAIACSIGFFPPVLLILPCILAVIGSLIYVVLLSKLNIRGGIFIPSLLLGLCLFTMAPYGMMTIFTGLFGLLGEIVYDTLGRKNMMWEMFGISLPAVGLALGEYIPLGFMRTAFDEMYADRFTSSISKTVMQMVNTPVTIILTLLSLILGIAGCIWGNKIISKKLGKQQ